MITLPHNLGKFLHEAKNNAKSFDIRDFNNLNLKNKKEWMANLYFKDIIETENKEIDINKSITGLSLDLMYMPKLS